MGLRKKKSLIDQAADYAEAMVPQIESTLASAKDKALPLIADARDKAGPALADARAKAAPIIAEGAAYAADKASIGASIAAEKAAIGRDLAAAKVAQIKGEPEPKRGKLKKLLLFGGLATALGLAVKKLRGDSAGDNWQSSYVPSPAPTASPSASTSASPAASKDETDDHTGSSPDEAIADAAEQPHPVTTPDDPAEVVDIDEAAPSKRKAAKKP